ncbi:MAG: hypothetical protein WA463_02870 [Terriglobales bacterium]
MTAAEVEQIWFNPPKFWAATKDMSTQQVDSLMDTVFFLAEIRNLDALRKFDFIGIGQSYLWPHRPEEAGVKPHDASQA